MLRKITLSTSSPITITAVNPANTFAVCSSLRFSKMNQPSPPDREETPKTSSAAMSVRYANAQPIFAPARIAGSAAGMRMCTTNRSPCSP